MSRKRLITSVVFDDDRSNISRMYRELECQHHLVQDRFDERPDIPGLTPVGFERWVTLLIQAHPEVEYERLQKAVLDMPISNPDDKKERFPKEISRRLFPRLEDRQVRSRIDRAISEHAKVDIPRHSHPELSSSHPPEPSLVPEPANNTPQIERERKPYASVPNEPAMDDPMTQSLPQPLERERKPYTAQPGGGKTYEEEMRAKEAESRYREPVKTAGGRTYEEDLRSRDQPKPGRSNSNAGRARPMSMNPNPQRLPDPLMQEAGRHHRASSNLRHRRSPSFSDSRRSDSDPHGDPRNDFRSYPPVFQSSAVPTEPIPLLEDEIRRYARDPDIKRTDSAARRRAEEDQRFPGENHRDRTRHDRVGELGGSYKTSSLAEEDYYRRNGGNGYENSQPYGGSAYR